MWLVLAGLAGIMIQKTLLPEPLQRLLAEHIQLMAVGVANSEVQ
jgi:hypothetical protein